MRRHRRAPSPDRLQTGIQGKRSPTSPLTSPLKTVPGPRAPYVFGVDNIRASNFPARPAASPSDKPASSACTGDRGLQSKKDGQENHSRAGEYHSAVEDKLPCRWERSIL
jgi:hypothetical protein